MEKWKASLYRCLLTVSPSPAWLQKCGKMHRADAAISEKQAEKIILALRRHRAVGAAVTLFNGQGILGTVTYGASQIKDGMPVPVTRDTAFRAASVSKHVTALAVMRLAQAGQIDLDADVDAFLPCSLRHPKAPNLAVTLRRLLSHTAGIQDGSAYAAACQAPVPLSELMKADCFAPEPDCFVYSNLGAGIIACVLEGMLKTDFESILQKTLFEPLAVDASFYPQKIQGEIADAYHVLPARQVVAPALDNALRRTRPMPDTTPDSSLHYLLAQGNLYISAPNLAKIGCEAMLPRYDAMRREIVPFGKRAYNLSEGLGTFIVRDAAVCPQIVYGHQGLAYGAMHGLFYDPESRRGFALLTSGASEARDGVLSDLNKSIMKLVFNDA